MSAYTKPMQIHRNYSLGNQNTFGVLVYAKYFAKVTSVAEFLELQKTAEFQNNKKMILGGGSNVLFTKDFDGLVILNSLKGVDYKFLPLGKGEVLKAEGVVVLQVASGENWHNFVIYTVEQGLCGIENLALIPGSVGAAPVQNIGAYGVEAKDTIISVEAIDMETGEVKTFSNTECQFGYRESFFKKEGKGKFFITSVTFQLSSEKELNTSYGAIRDILAEKNISEPTVRDIADVVITIRQSKLPDPKIIGNAGSFFKNPVVSMEQFENIQQQFPEVKRYPLDSGQVKIPAGWLIETAGWKGQRVGNVGVHDKQALVLVNHGGATGQEVYDLACAIQNDITEKFGIELEMEVTVV